MNKPANTTSDWTPGIPAKVKKPAGFPVSWPEKSVVQIVGDILLDHFLRENPPADKVKLVPNSLRLEDGRDMWRAKVQTFVNLEKIGILIHESNVKFRVEKIKNKDGKEFYVIYHNHIIFPAAL
jgi:hypothetical protein